MVKTLSPQPSGVSGFVQVEIDTASNEPTSSKPPTYTTQLSGANEDFPSEYRPNLKKARSAPVREISTNHLRERLEFTRDLQHRAREPTIQLSFYVQNENDRKEDPPIPLRYLIIFIVLEISRNIVLINFGGWQRWILIGPIILLGLTHIWDTVNFYREQKSWCEVTHKGEFTYWYKHPIWQDTLSKYCYGVSESTTVAILVVFFTLAYLVAILVRILEVVNEDKSALESNFHYYIAAESVIYMLFFILEVDYFTAFGDIQQKIAPLVEKFKLRIVLIVLILLFSISLVITLNLSDSEEEDRIIHNSWFDGFEVFGVFICCLMCVILALINWDLISFQIANNDWVLAFIYFTFFGWIFMEIARWLHPPEIYTKVTWAWHQQPKDLSKTVHLMIMLAVLGTFLLPFGAGILLATFAEMANAMSGGGNGISGGVAIIIVIAFLIIAHFMMVNPAAGASMIDMCGGFIFVPIFMDAWNMGFGSALVLAQAILLFSHFTGSSLQWWLGKKPKVQAWLNRITPVIVLAVLDSTLREANWFQVGLIGGVFPDTINGFNQGRINMEFWTQFLSEWSALPNAAVMILNGAVLSQPNTSLLTLLPVFIVIAVMVNVVGAFYATRALYQNVGAPTYLCSVSKWTTVQYMQSINGVVPMKTGWEEDVYDMTKDGGLFDTTLPIQLARIKHLTEKEIQNDPKANKDLTEHYEDKYFDAIQRHLELLMKKQDALTQDDLLHLNPDLKNQEKESEWHEASFIDGNGEKKDEIPRKFYCQLVFLVFLYITFGISAVVFRVALEETVQGGFTQIAENEYYPYGIAALILHFMVAAMYFRESLVPCWYTIVWFFGILKQKVTCQDTDGNKIEVETDFKMPEWKNIDKDFSDEADIIIAEAKNQFPRCSTKSLQSELPIKWEDDDNAHKRSMDENALPVILDDQVSVNNKRLSEQESTKMFEKRKMYSKSETDIPRLASERSRSLKPMSDVTTPRSQNSNLTFHSSSNPQGAKISTPAETPLAGDAIVIVEENDMVDGDNIDFIDSDVISEGDNLENASLATTPEIPATSPSDNDSPAGTPGSDVHEDNVLREEAPPKREKVARRISAQPVHSEDEVFEYEFHDNYFDKDGTQKPASHDEIVVDPNPLSAKRDVISNSGYINTQSGFEGVFFE